MSEILNPSALMFASIAGTFSSIVASSRISPLGVTIK